MCVMCSLVCYWWDSLSCGIGVYSHTDLLVCLFICLHVWAYFQNFLSVVIWMEICLGISHTWYLCLDSTLYPFPQLMTFYSGYFSLSYPLSFVPLRLLKFYTFRSPATNNRGDRNNWIICHGYNLVPQKNSDFCLLSL